MARSYSQSIPRYQKIALDIASRIASGDFLEGDKLSGRSFVASKYKVSSETARKAFCILADLDIVAPKKGSGMYVTSKENAAVFVKQFANQSNIETLKNEIFHNLSNQKNEMDELRKKLAELISATELYRSINPLMPHIIPITADCKYLGQTLTSIQFWQNTGGTVVAARRDGELLVSPGSYLTLTEGDEIYVVTQEPNDKRLRSFLYDHDELVPSYQ